MADGPHLLLPKETRVASAVGRSTWIDGLRCLLTAVHPSGRHRNLEPCVVKLSHIYFHFTTGNVTDVGLETQDSRLEIATR